jgi:hypothetical protein
MTFPTGNELNARELATLTWVAVGFAYTLTRPGTAKAVAQLLRAFTSRWIAGPLAGMLVWMGLAVWLASLIDVWTTNLIKDSIEWLILSALLLYVNLMRASRDRGYFRRAVVDNLRLAAFFAFYVNVFVFSYPIELGLVLVATLLAGCSLVAEYRAEARDAKRFFDGALVVIAILLISYSTQQIIDHWSTIDLEHQLRLLILPIWLTIVLVPYLHAWSLFASYQMTFHRIAFLSPGRIVSHRVILATMIVLNVRSRAVAALSSPWLERLASAATFREAVEVSRAYLANWKRAGTAPSSNAGKDRESVTPAIPIPGIRQILEREKRGSNGEAMPE